MLLILLMIYVVAMTIIDHVIRGESTIQSIFFGIIWALFMFYLCFKEDKDALFWIPLIIVSIVLLAFYGWGVAVAYVVALFIVRAVYRGLVG